MKIRFANASLARCFNEQSHAAGHWGADVADQYARVVNFLTCVDGPADLPKFAFLQARAVITSEEPRWRVQLMENWRVILEPAEGGQSFIVTAVVHFGD